MKQFMSLLKLHLKLKFTFPELRYNLRANPKKARRTIGMAILIVFVICYVIAFYGFIAYNILDAAMATGMGAALLTIGIMAAQIVILFFGIFYMMGLYHTKDMELLASMPITQGKVFGVKFIMTLISEIGTFALFTVPIIIIYGIKAGADYGFYLKAIVVVLFGALLPMAISGLIAALLVRASIFTRRKDLFAVIGGFILVGGLMVGNMLISTSMTRSLMEGGLAQAVQNQGALLNAIAGSFPPAVWAANGLTLPGWAGLGWLGLFALVSLAGAALVALVAGSMYYSGALAQLESSRRSKAKDVSGDYGRVSSPVYAIFKKEWKVVLRTPIYAMNSLFGIVVGPILIVIMTMGGGGNGGFAAIGKMLRDAVPVVAPLVLTGLMVFVGSMNPASATVISREGRAFWLAKMIPVSAQQQIKGKYWFSVSITLFGVITTAVLGGIILNLPLLSVLAGAIVAVLLGSAVSAIGVTMDMAKPKLIWESEQQAIKQNMNAFFATMLGFVAIGLFALLAVLLVMSKLPEAVVWIILITVALGMAILFERVMSSKAERAYERIDS